MDVVILFNGLGNQMSQYAFYLAKKENKINTYCIFDRRSHDHNGYELSKIFGIRITKGIKGILLQFLYKLRTSIRTQFLSPLFNIIGLRYFEDPVNYDYIPSLVNKGPKGINFYHGGWHSEKNFEIVKEKVRMVYHFNEKQDSKEFQSVLNLIKGYEETVSVHVRRGDYFCIPKSSKRQPGGIANEEYYQKAIDKINLLVKAPMFIVFSNDITWCRSFFQGGNVFFVDCNKGSDSWRDMYLMSLCKNHIIANSTFSWWGAWLGDNHEGVTICPKQFIRDIETKDIYPSKWLKIE